MSKFLRIFRRGASPAQRASRPDGQAPADRAVDGTQHPSGSAVADRPSGRTLFIGHTRFSVHQHGSAYFNATRGSELGAGFTEDEYTTWLYSETRLAPRTEIFTTLSLPQLALAAEHHDVLHYVSYSPSLPEHHKEQLKAAAQKYSFLRLNETTKPVNSTPSRTLVNQALAERDHGTGPFGVYRLDDDDLLSVRYFDQMAPYVTPGHVGWWVSLGTGFSAIRMNGRYAYTRDLYYPKSAFGPMAIAARDAAGTIANLSAPKHTVMDKFNPTILDSREPGYFHIRHESQDSTVKGSVAPFYPEAMTRILGEGPADLHQVAELFPVLNNQTTLEPGPEAHGLLLSDGPLTLSREVVSYDWDVDGPLALVVEPSEDTRIRANQVQVRLTVASTTETEVDHKGGVMQFFSQGKFKHSERDGTYWSYIPPKTSGFGHVLPIEPPRNVKITKITLITSKSESVQVNSVRAYPLPARRA